MPGLQPTTDGVVEIRPPKEGEADVLIAGRDEAFHRFMGEGSDDPQPTGCVVVDDAVVGWVDFDSDRAWLEPGEVNLGYNVFAAHRGNGYATRALQLLMHHLALTGGASTATLLIHPDNARSLALAARAGFTPHGDLDGNPYWKRSVPPLAYSDGTVTIRRRHPDDLDADLGAKDDEQIRWLWLPAHRERWEAMTIGQRRAHALRALRAEHDGFGTGPKWTFTVDADQTRGVAYADCDLANANIPKGDANISYATHPRHRRRGYASAAVRLIMRFLADHTAARTAHVITDKDNTASRLVASAVGAEPRDRWVDDGGHTMIRNAAEIRRRP